MEKAIAGIFFGIPYLIMIILMILGCFIDTYLNIKHAIQTKDWEYLEFFIAVTLLAACTGYILGGIA